MVKYFADLMLKGYRSMPKIKLEAKNDAEAFEMAWDLAKQQDGCIAFSACKRVGNKKFEYFGRS